MAYTTIDKPTDYFETILYTGNGSSLDVSGLDFSPGWVWIKKRSNASNSMVYDTVRGVKKHLHTNTTDVEVSEADDDIGLNSFNSDGFTVKVNGNTNTNTHTYAAWNWKTGTTFTNDASSTSVGDIDSSGSVSTTAGFSIITATSDGAANKDIAHGLGAVPDVIFAKNLARTYNWDCYFKTLGYNASLILNENNATRTGAWGSNTFTTTTFETADDYSSKSGEAYIYYCFAEKKGYSKFGSYTGNGSTDGTFVYLGFKPAFVMVKITSATSNWDISTGAVSANQIDERLRANLSNAEESSGYIDFLSNGFKMRNTNTSQNLSGGSYIYMAFAESPFVNSNGVPTNAR